MLLLFAFLFLPCFLKTYQILFRNSLVVKWLGLCASTAGGPVSIPGWGTKISQAVWRGQKIILFR